ncbi:MAG: molybdate ABC transporter substrate-binding protein [Phormidesmis sp.]
MNRRWFASLFAKAVGAAVCLGPLSCRQEPLAKAHRETVEETIDLTISVAASLQKVMESVKLAYQQQAPKVMITYNFGASGSLTQQIVQGAPVDVFLSASADWMDALDEQSLVLKTSRKILLENELVLVVPASDTETVSFEEMKTDRIERIAIGEPDSVPVGQYAKESLLAMGLFEVVQQKLVLGKDARQVLSYVETGSVAAGLVYSTDALASELVRVVATVPADDHSPIVYPVAVMAASKQAAAAQAFVDFLSGGVAMKIFRAGGFELVE